MKRISIISPCYNEEDNAAQICAAAIAQLETAGVSFDVIFIDNDSTDRTVAITPDTCTCSARM